MLDHYVIFKKYSTQQKIGNSCGRFGKVSFV